MDITNEYRLLSNIDNSTHLTMRSKEGTTGDDSGHCHPNMEIILITQGTGVVKINNEYVVNVSEGDILVFDSMQLHQLFYVESEEKFCVMAIEFNIRNFITDEFKVFGKKDVERFFIKLYNSDNVIPKDSETAFQVKNLLLHMEEKLKQKKHSVHVIRAQMLLIFALVLEYYDEYYDMSGVEKSKQNKYIEKSMIYINQHIDEQLTLEMLARMANMGKSYYSTMFKKVNGVTVWEYILNMRIELAISYMSMYNNKYNISEIAQMCGFNNAANFNRVFKRITGKTPRAYKKSNNNTCFSK